MNQTKFNITKFLTRKPIIIKDETVFEPTFIPENLLHRDKEISLVANHLKSIVSRSTKTSGKQLIIQGPIGIGKTVVAKHFGLTLERYCQSSSDVNIAKIVYFHMNCRRQRSWYLILTSILRQLVPAFPVRGFGANELLTYLVHIITERNQGLLICLDEIDYLLSESKGVDVFYSLIRHHEGINQNIQAQISLICVTRNPHFLNLLDSALLSSLSQRVIVFEPYTTKQLFDILLQRAQQGLYESAYSKAVLETIASLAFNNGDARYAIELLWRSAKVAEQEECPTINFEHVRKAQVSVFPINHSIITDLPPQLKRVLLALASLLNSKKNIAHVTSKELLEKYSEICKKSQERPRKHTQFWNYLQQLAKQGLVELEVQNRHKNGKSAGRTTYIGISDLPIGELLILLNQDQQN
ncbi:MAG: Cdc6/Cdc18 family protein [Candidatus Hodarchaeota archaeon]